MIIDGMSKRTVFTTITPLPVGITREVVIDFLHNHLEMIDLNPLVQERHPIKPPAHAEPEEFHCTWYSLTDKISYIPGGLVTGDVTYTCAFHDLPTGLQTHCYAPAGLNIRDKWTLNGSLPGEPVQPVELGIGAPVQGLYIREDVDMKCNIVMTSFVKKTLKKSHAALVERLKVKATIATAAANAIANAKGRLSTSTTGSSSTHNESIRRQQSSSTVNSTVSTISTTTVSSIGTWPPPSTSSTTSTASTTGSYVQSGNPQPGRGYTVSPASSQQQQQQQQQQQKLCLPGQTYTYEPYTPQYQYRYQTSRVSPPQVLYGKTLPAPNSNSDSNLFPEPLRIISSGGGGSGRGLQRGGAMGIGRDVSWRTVQSRRPLLYLNGNSVSSHYPDTPTTVLSSSGGFESSPVANPDYPQLNPYADGDIIKEVEGGNSLGKQDEGNPTNPPKQIHVQVQRVYTMGTGHLTGRLNGPFIAELE
ncbi:hypothetical protein QBC46DRAFT_461525 [Diplogelasinospora grovesii]|uniref:DUF7053 domain-containing protein n=1 Tax=Diplogelasinospora grovesii TaxID=303347 RepID=A0AAN6S1J2_9PEZI|nr:hypothetical protein QBC46DRAFT_461525 [Diplogelasinospora grovesii]